jgi:hypothetical protein
VAALSGRAHGLARWCLVALAAALATAASFGSASAAPQPTLRAVPAGSIGLRLVDIPVNTHGDDRALLYIVDHLAPGTVIHRRIEVSNTTGSSEHVALYAAAASIDHGAFLVADAHTPDELSTWTSLDRNAVNVAAGRQSLATVRIAVPDDAAPGERYAVIWAEVRSDPRGTDAVVQVNRVGIRVYLSVGFGNPPAEDFSIDSLTATRSPEGLPMVLATVLNTGGRALDMRGTLELEHGPGGLNAGPFPASLGTTLAPGDTGTVTVLLDAQVPAGPWDARIDLQSGLLERTERATFTFPAEGAVTVATRHGWRWSLITGAALLLVLGVGGLILLVARRRRAARSEPRPPRGARRQSPLPSPATQG